MKDAHLYIKGSVIKLLNISKSPYFQHNHIALFQADSLSLLKEMEDESVDMIFADPPYFLSNGGISCQSGEMVSVDKGDWDKEIDLTMDEFNLQFLSEAQRILTRNGTIWVSGTMHNIFSLGAQMNKLKFKILNNITWQKSNPAPNLSCRMFTHSTENIIWAKKNEKSKQTFHYHLMKNENGGKQMKDVWTFSTTKQSEKKFGRHPTQKPLNLLTRIIKASTNEGDIILDPFLGSGTTALAAMKMGRKCIGIDLEVEFLNIAKQRILNENPSEQGELLLW